MGPGVRSLTGVGFCLHQNFQDARMSRMDGRGGRVVDLPAS